MDEGKKKERTGKARTLTRRIKELRTTIDSQSSFIDVEEKINRVKFSFEELGIIQDQLLDTITEQDEGYDETVAWYDKYDSDVNKDIARAREYLESLKSQETQSQVMPIKIKKLSIPVFESQPKKYLKWKSTFERYTERLNSDIKYDYLLQNTKGYAHEFVANKSTYAEAIDKLDKEFGNKHVIINMLIDDIKAISVVRKGDFRAFEHLTHEASNFRDRLLEMGCSAESENSYVLKELESKLCADDCQKWLESMGNAVDVRKVEDIVKWLEHQRNLRRISSSSSYRSYSNLNSSGVEETISQVNIVRRSSTCDACNQTPHHLSSCPVFQAWSNNEKWDFVKRKRLCFQCLKGDHRRVDCTAPKCNVCERPHHNILHNSRAITQYNSISENTGERTPPFNSSIASLDIPLVGSTANLDKRFPPRCFLPVFKSTVIHDRYKVHATTLLDSGSELNVMSSKLCKKLRLTGSPITINIIGVAGEVTQRRTNVVEVTIQDRLGCQTIIQCIVLDQACGKALEVDPQVFSAFGDNLPVPKEELHLRGGEIELLIGMTSPHLHQQFSLYGRRNEVMIMETRLGTSLVGCAPDTRTGNYECGVVNSNRISIAEEKELLKFVEAETAGIRKECECQTKTDEELLFENFMKDAWSNDSSGRFEVKLPWKVDPGTLSNNREQAVARSVSLERKLSKNPEVLKMFNDQVEDMISSNILKKVEHSYPKRYLPLLAVVDLDRDSSKVRVCLDSKSKHSGMSLNDAFLKGKYELSDIFQIITRFRCGSFASVGDVRKMFWQIKIHEQDQMYHGVIHKGSTYVFTRVCFGNSPSPPIADMSMVKMAYDGKQLYPLASKALIYNRFMDDLINANSDPTVLDQTRIQVDKLIGKFGFQIKEWFSNHPVIGAVKKSKKVLGITWDIESDKLCMSINRSDKKVLTKRNVLSRMAEVWDPLGICAGVVLIGKLLFQSIIRLQFGWDHIIQNSDLQKKWDTWIHEIESCNNVIVSRSILPSEKYKNENMDGELMGFSDGSNVGYGCALYMRWKNCDESIIDIKFLCAKANVSPIRGNTTPRSELKGAGTLARLAWSTLEAFKQTELTGNGLNIKLNSDSTTVLSWIRSPAINYKPYVKNKIIEIQTLLPSSVWRYVPSAKNKAADLLSKGCLKSELNVILEGPDILRIPSKEWPKQPECKNSIDVEKVEIVHVAAATITEPLIDVKKFNSWRKLVRVTAYVIKYINRLRERRQVDDTSVQEDGYYPTPTHDEIKQAESYWIRYAQREFNENDKVLQKLVPFDDNSGIKRVTGRISNSQIFDYDRKHPILLPAKSRISYIILMDIHNDLFHPGHNRVLAESRKKFWIINARRLSKTIGSKCTVCRRWRGKPLGQLMADLPWFRINPGGAPFENISIDYFGPFFIKFGRKQRTKAYGIIYACLTTRAIHLDMATNLTTDNFLLALRRFISIYGQPKYIRSDNGKNFRGAAREISEMNKRWRDNDDDARKLNDFVARYDIKWTFSTPLASHHNGAIESLIKTVKNALNKIVNERVLTDEEYRTVLAQVQSLVNSRPLWPSNDGDIDAPPITCHDLLRPHGLLLHPPQLNHGNPKFRYDYIEKLVSEWWRLWLRHFLPNLQSRTKWLKVRENVEKGDIVLIIDPDMKRGQWKMGKVTETFPGTDGKIRSVKVGTSTGSYDRPITKLCLLLSKNEY